MSGHPEKIVFLAEIRVRADIEPHGGKLPDMAFFSHLSDMGVNAK